MQFIPMLVSWSFNDALSTSYVTQHQHGGFLGYLTTLSQLCMLHSIERGEFLGYLTTLSQLHVLHSIERGDDY
jgi:hypothetical protein